MEELKEYLNEMMEVYNTTNDNYERHRKISDLWTKYYKRSEELGITLEDAYNMQLINESESYIINQEPDMTKIDDQKVVEAINNLSDFNFVSEEEANDILKYVVYNARINIEMLGVNIKKNSLNGYCELVQSLSLRAFDELGLKTTKNSAKKSLNYKFNHFFGTVTFPIKKDNEIIYKTYLIDPTYRQFFTTVRCNEGRYHTNDEIHNIKTAPDPGYFVIDDKFAKQLMKDGYIELTRKNAEKYGRPFYLSSLDRSADVENIDFYNNIINSMEDYSLSEEQLEGLKISFPEENKKISF